MIYKLLVGIHTSVNFCGKNGAKHVHVMLSEQGHIFFIFRVYFRHSSHRITKNHKSDIIHISLGLKRCF